MESSSVEIARKRVQTVSNHITGGVPHSPEPGEKTVLTDLALVGLICCWGYGLVMPLHGLYELVQYAKYQRLATYAILLSLSKLPRDTALFRPFSHLYKTTFATHFPETRFLTPSVMRTETDPSPEKCQVIIAGPHGLFSLALMRIIPADARMKLFVDNTLATVNPFIPLFGKWSGMKDLDGLQNKKVTKCMKAGDHDVMVVAGGFEEASVGTGTCNRICRQTWGYWMRKALQNGFDISFMWVYGGTQVFHQPELGVSVRHMFAKRSIPCILPIGKMYLPVPTNTQLQVVNFRMQLPHIPDCTREQAREWQVKFEARVQQLLRDYPPLEGLAPVMPLKPWLDEKSK
mmetsp:Transcript_37119/g.44868  ORF Transcript_37119/g.44868 Transcript_37119/m.44868 type:complete len:346 (-) Transcript_37119:699-1736(-)